MQRTRNRERNAEVMKAHGQRKHSAVRDMGETEEKKEQEETEETEERGVGRAAI